MSVAPVLQLEAALLRRQLPDLLLRPGMTLFARVAEREGRHGIIVLAGSPLVAELPDEVQVGDKLRLLVQDTRGDRVAMKLIQEQPAAAPQTPVVGLRCRTGRRRESRWATRRATRIPTIPSTPRSRSPMTHPRSAPWVSACPWRP